MIKLRKLRGKIMSRRTKLEFEPLSLEETAKQLGIPRRRAQGILTLVGVRDAHRRPIRAAKKRTARASTRSTNKISR
jgi:hypothetical protein